MGQEALQRFEMWLIDQFGQQAHQAPGQRGLVQQGLGRNLGTPQDQAVQLPHEAAGQLHINGCGNATTAHVVFFRVFGQCQLQPLGNTVALHQGDFVFQGRQRITPHPTDHQATQFIQAVAVNHHKTSTE
ncbi:hypothetical protein D3C81_1751920 [compost metagenome]